MATLQNRFTKSETRRVKTRVLRQSTLAPHIIPTIQSLEQEYQHAHVLTA
jgi:hypothetical protein